jgi:hypothetical protein
MDPLEDECSMEMTFRVMETVRQWSSTAEIHDWRCGRVSELHIHMLSLPQRRVLLISNYMYQGCRAMAFILRLQNYLLGHDSSRQGF